MLPQAAAGAGGEGSGTACAPPKAKTPWILHQDPTLLQQLEAGRIRIDPFPQDGALGSGIRATRASRGKAWLQHQRVTEQKATSQALPTHPSVDSVQSVV